MVVWSPSVGKKVKAAMDNGDYRSANKWLNYGRANSWVDNSGQPSTYYQQLARKLGVTYEIPKGKSVSDEVFESTSPYLRSRFGDQSKGGGWVRVQFYNIEMDGFETLGYIPLAKINDDGKLKMYSIHSDVFWDIEPTFYQSELIKESETRLNTLIIDFTTGLFLPMDIMDIGELVDRKMALQIKGKLRTAGNNSSVNVDEVDPATGKVLKVHTFTFKINDDRTESFIHNETDTLTDDGLEIH